MNATSPLPPQPAPQLLALDWGTSRLRAYLMAAGAVVAERESAHGIQHLPQPGAVGYAAALAGIAGDWLARWPDLPLLACGMVGSAQGWREAPYVRCPADVAALAAQAVPVEAAHARPLWIVPGMLDAALGRMPDVMRGEETQIAGALDRDTADARRGFILPGTHSKWATVEAGRLLRFSTYLTGELYAVLRTHSILGRLMPAGEAPCADDAFARGVAAGGDGALTHQLFSVRTLALTGELAPEALPDYLSGLLIGHELSQELGSQQRQKPGQKLAAAGGEGEAEAPPAGYTLIGDPTLCARYARAFVLLGEAAPPVLANSAPRGLWRIAEARGLVPS